MQQIASSTPPRRAKRLCSPNPHPRSILPKQVLQSSEPPPDSPPPQRRGKKSAPLSRSAREAQRRLNHSIIEKARRTKINNALATLKQLVPLDYGSKAKSQDNNNSNNGDDDDDNDDDDDDGEYGIDKKKPIKSKSGKKEEKEREYKLEILVRTVAFMQDLLQRVAILEQANPLCSKCRGVLPTESQCNSTTPELEPSLPSKRARTESYDSRGIPSPHESSPPDLLSKQNRLPSISSWLPGTLDSSALSLRNNGDWVSSAQLPTPPSSTQVRPAITSAYSSHRGISSSSPFLMRTPEEEHAATMLLQISGAASSSPPFRPLPPSIISPTDSLHHILPLTSTSAASFGMHLRKTMEGRYDLESMGIQTPSSLLGLDQA